MASTLRKLFAAMLLLLMLGVSTLGRAELRQSSTTGLDFEKVFFVVNTRHDVQKRFYDRAMSRFARAGLHPSPVSHYQEGQPLLELILDSQALDKSCGDKVLYTRKLALQENVFIQRSPDVRTFSTTWDDGTPPYVTESPSVEQLEADLDRLVDAFIVDYKYANSGKRKSS